MKKSITRLIVLLLAIVGIVSFIGCDLTGTESFNSLTEESRKGKPAASTAVEPLPVFTGSTGSVLPLAEEDYIINYFIDESLIGVDYSLEPFPFTPESETVSFFYLDSNGERVFVPEGDASATHKLTETEGTQAITPEVIGQRIIGWESAVYNLWAGQDNDAGSVTISNDNEFFYINVDTNTTADLQEVHIYFYEDASALPDKRPSPGLAPYTLENIYADSAELVIPISALFNGDGNPEDYFFIIHAALVEDAAGSVDGTSNAGETAYAGGDVPGFDGKGAWFYAVNFTLNPVFEDIIGYIIETVVFEEVELLPTTTGGNDTDYFPVWGATDSKPQGQSISHIILVFDQTDGDVYGDGYYSVKFDGWPDSADNDLDNSIDALLAYLVANDEFVTANSVLLGSSIKGGNTYAAAFYVYGSGTNEPDAPPVGWDIVYTGVPGANELNQNLLDNTYQYGDVF